MKDNTMALFIAVGALIVGVANMGFHQGHDNPTASSFFSSNSHIKDAGNPW